MDETRRVADVARNVRKDVDLLVDAGNDGATIGSMIDAIFCLAEQVERVADEIAKSRETRKAPSYRPLFPGV